ncbi:pyridoxamine 5'-phosphate oxidase [Botrimarina sp.]|uniref:pyridoxamine 5'-phosphate oxidase n=1 Tax=Botrimarina sp. TaxID=2795802 RepID=UPI0032EE4C7A
MSDHPIHALRRSYESAALRESEAGDDPIALFDHWFKEAAQASPGEWLEVNAMTLATASADGEVTARVVLLKGFSADGFCFYTNYKSHKGQQLAANPQAALVFFWPHVERQVRVSGPVRRLAREDAAAYFATRPRASQLGAAASDQSSVIASREALAERFREVDSRHAGKEIPMPPDWGGYAVRPQAIEFWQGRPGRLHDRLRYVRTADGWDRTRLCP